MTDFFARLFTAVSTLGENRERDERGATMVEYAILVSLISIAGLAAIVLIGPKILAAFQAVANAMP
jgi:pilus assembly protein Flp/PilA